MATFTKLKIPDCVICNGYGEVCDGCGESEDTCEGCEDENGDVNFSQCPECYGSGKQEE